MSYCRDEENGKDKVVFLTEEDNEELLQQSSAVLAEDDGADEVDPNDQRTAIGPDGEIDWDCPCLKGMAHGTCGQEFRDAFSCFAKSEAEPKGMDCVDAFEVMQACIKAHPEEYGQYDRDNDDDDDLDEQVGAEGAAAPSTDTKKEESAVETKQ